MIVRIYYDGIVNIYSYIFVYAGKLDVIRNEILIANCC